ncbi:efflux RND transporter periplasmic adaptor subunit [uncultured Deefgea sp.]|uniref:efflux RND transporter periplasmic adaptor subunit n=1 Tax=uncultured Deefgea sp. TaxID=1304914 RepID=UPI002599EB85|nr:efflux RND transporter periplasmic adaptor subunit [uncultured Deefgea sp.]
MLNKWSVPLLVAMVVLAGCKSEQKPVEEIRPVRTMLVGGALPAAAEVYSGEVKAQHEVPMGFRIAGKMISRAVSVGDTVKKGQVLAQLDAGDVALNATGARAALSSAQAQLAQAKLDYQRSQDLHAQNFVSQAEVDKRQTALISAQKLSEQAKAHVDLANNQSSYAQLIADGDGVITQTLAEPGSVVSAGQSVLMLAKAGQYEAVIDVPENRVHAWQPGQKVAVQLWADADRALVGTVSEVAPAADSKTRTFRVKVALPEKNTAALGMTIQVSQVFASKEIPNEISVPMSAIFGKEQMMRVWLVDNKNTVHSQPITVLGHQGQQVRIEGIPAKSTVVTAGVHLLREGQKIKVLPLVQGAQQ